MCRRRIYQSAINFCLMFALLSCKKDQATEMSYRLGAIEKTSKSFLIPRSLKSEIEKLYLNFIRKENPKIVLKDEEILSRIPRDFLDIEIKLRASAPGVLSENIEFNLPRGGGEINLSEYVIGKKGSFYMTYKVNRSSELQHEITNLKVFYLSEAKQRTISEEKFGSGCSKYMDVTEFMSKVNKAGGLQLNATQQRYLSVIAGIFYFVNFDSERKIYIAAVRFTDSRYPDLLCPPDVPNDV